MVKFGKTGTDVTTAAVRLARACTGKKQVLVGGYHGWADWSAVTMEDKNRGIPDSGYSYKFDYGTDYLVPTNDDIAAIIIEPTHDAPAMKWLRHHCDEQGIVLIFDEIQTGFRYSLGGAQKLFGITPDLACFGKSMANGMPLSALVGKRDLMQMMDGKHGVFFSGTFFGDTLSIAASLATIDKMEKENVIQHLWNTGSEIRNSILQNPKSKYVELYGLDPLVKIKFKDWPSATKEQLQALFTQEMAKEGVLVLNAHGVSYSIKDPEIQRIVDAYSKTLNIMADAIENQGMITRYLTGTITGKAVR
jgi:glutamate-1-semialdehyde 2,1-aminomutase